MSAYQLAMVWAGIFLLAGLLTGVWKYRCILRSADATAPNYVDIAHRAALLYSFAAVLLALLAKGSVWPAWVNLLGVWLNVVFFALAIATYCLHGFLRDTDNQLRKPYTLGAGTVPAPAIEGFMLALMAAEIAGLLILLSGFWLGVGG